jgi:hypothetical protein
MLFLEEPKIGSYERKRLVTKLRYYAGRLVYLCSSDELLIINKQLSRYKELYVISAVIEALSSRDVSKILRLGINAVQSAAQMLKLHGGIVKCSLSSFGAVEMQGLATLEFNGIKVEILSESINKNDPLYSFAFGLGIRNLMKDNNLFIQELASLHGVTDRTRHVLLLNSVFHKDEQLAFDLINQLHGSSISIT